MFKNVCCNIIKLGNRDKRAIGRGITFAIKHNLYFMISVTFSTLLWLWPVLRSYLLILGWYFQILLLFHLTNYFNFCTCVWKKWSNYSWCYINFMSTYINCLFFISGILEPSVTVLKITFNYEVISSKFPVV